MKYGCIGERLKHSFSKEIHNALADYEYELCEVGREELRQFAKDKDFIAINVTIPYKEQIIPYLDFVDEFAKSIGAVNTVVNRDGRLYGYNTDFYGMRRLIEKAGYAPKGKKSLILGTGGTSKTAVAVLRAMGASEIIRVSRDGKEGAITYEEAYRDHGDCGMILNTTPVGMYPNTEGCPIDTGRFTQVECVIDAVYNPLRTSLILSAEERGIACMGGLYMLVAQAVRASEIFLDTQYGEDTVDKIYRRIKSEKENIVLIGMPSSGKSTVGKILAEKLGRELMDTDSLIVAKRGEEIPDIFAREGEEAFRGYEREAIKEVSRDTRLVIATGGGAVLRRENTFELRKNGRIYFIDRPLDKLMPTEDRPLSRSREAIEQRYAERYPIYRASADAVINGDCDAEAVADKITEEFERESV